MKKKIFTLSLATVAALSLAACGKTTTTSSDSVKDDLTKSVELKMNLAYGNKSQTITYAQSSPLTLPDGKTVVTSGQLKPFWTHVSNELNINMKDVTVQDQKAKDMITTAAATGFSDATVYGGNSIGESLMSYGTQGMFTSISQLMDQGNLPNFKAYLEKNPNVKSAITTYDGQIYHIPYIAEIGQYARDFHMRKSWVTGLLDGDSQAYDTDTIINKSYTGAFTGANARTGSNGGTVTPKTGITITKKTNQNIVEIMNNLSSMNGANLAQALKKYIKDNYDYTNPSELYLGEKAAYDMDELVALFRVIKANPKFLTDGKATEVYPYFTRQSKYREDILRFSTYLDGGKVHGSDSYESRFEIDKNGELQYTYSKESVYNNLSAYSQMYKEGLFYNDCLDLKNTANFRSRLYGTDKATNPQYGFMTFDFTASTTADALNPDVVGVLPPVSKVNGVWQYYIDNSRVIKPDGWAISKASSQEQILRAASLFDYIFSEAGAKAQNYGLPDMLDNSASFVGPDGKTYPKYANWTTTTATAVANGDLSSFLRNWVGSLMPIGYAKEIGFEYQYTSQRGFDAWKLLQNSTCNIPTYDGNGISGDNPNYYKLVPPVFSLTKIQNETLQNDTSMSNSDFIEFMFNVVRYKELGNEPSGTNVPRTYDAYLKVFKDAGLDIFVRTYQAAYKAQNVK